MTAAYAQVTCHDCGTVGLDYEEYMRQLFAAWSTWKCPKCGQAAVFDDAYYEATHLPPEDEE